MWRKSGINCQEALCHFDPCGDGKREKKKGEVERLSFIQMINIKEKNIKDGRYLNFNQHKWFYKFVFDILGSVLYFCSNNSVVLRYDLEDITKTIIAVFIISGS